MSLRLRIVEFYLPGFIKIRRFRDLFELTAQAFETPIPDLHGLSFEETLSAYAKFTKNQVERIAGSVSRLAIIRERLRERAFAFGRKLGKDLGVRTRMDVLRAGRLLYKLLRIDFRGTPKGEIEIASCSFSGLYSPKTCETISGLDEGLLAGLAGGGTLIFSARITEGRDACRACFHFPETLP